jgi:hypothetical protein
MLRYRMLRIFAAGVLLLLSSLLAACPPNQSFYIVVNPITVNPPGDTGKFTIVANPGAVNLGNNLGNGTVVPATPLQTSNNTLVVTGYGGTNIADYDAMWGGACNPSGAVSIAVNSTATCTLTLTHKTIQPPPTPEPVACNVFDDGYTNMEGPSSAIFISGRTATSSHPDERGMACIPNGQFGHCHKWFGRCQTVTTHRPVTFQVFDDGSANPSAQSDAVFIPKAGNQACIPDQSPTGTCRRWFGNGVTADRHQVSCAVFDDGNANQTSGSGAIYIPHPIPPGGLACIPDQTSTGTCRRWWGACVAAP